VKQKQNSNASVDSLGNAPNVAYEKARQQWAERMGEPIVEKNRWFVVAILLGLALIASLAAISNLIPLKTVVPYGIQIDRATGEVTAKPIAATDFKPGQAEKKYFITRWIRDIIDLEPNITERNLREAFGFVRGKAIEEYKDFMNQTKPLLRLREEPTLTRKTDIISFNFMTDNTANIRFQTEERQASVAPVIKRYAAFVTYELLAPTTDRDIVENPLGLFITHFTISEEINK
jgi:type IV secretion system protein VirB5